MAFFVVDTDEDRFEIAGDAFSIDQGILKIHKNQKVIGGFKEWNFFQYKDAKVEEEPSKTMPPELNSIVELMKKISELHNASN